MSAYHPAAHALQALISLSNEIERELAAALGLNLTDYRALAIVAMAEASTLRVWLAGSSTVRKAKSGRPSIRKRKPGCPPGRSRPISASPRC